MSHQSCDVAILGSGFAGSLLGTVLAKRGVSTLLIDAGTHPRFAIGESTIPHTSLLLSLLGLRYGIPEIDDLAYPDRIAARVCSTCGIKRSFGFAYHRPGREYDPREGLQFGTSSKDENHFFRQDVDAFLFHTALRYGAAARPATRVEEIELGDDGVRLTTDHGEEIRARYLVDSTGPRSPLLERLELLEEPPRFRHRSRSLFTHMLGVRPFREGDPALTLPWHQSTLHHVFDGGWFWVIPFDNREGSTNPLVSVGLTLDPRRYPRDPAVAPEDELHAFLERYPSVAEQFAGARAARPWISTGRLQHSTRRAVGDRWCLMSNTAGIVDPLFSRGLINTVEIVWALVPELEAALVDGDYSAERFAGVEALHRRVLDYNDRLVDRAFRSFADFDLFNAWLRVWALGTILTEFRLMSALADFAAGTPPEELGGEASRPVFSDFEDPDYAEFFAAAAAEVDRFEAGEQTAAKAAERIYDLAGRYEFPVLLSREAMLRAGWLADGVEMSDRSVGFARTGYRWAITNPTTRDLFGTAETFYRWRAQRPDPHLAEPAAERAERT